MSTLLPFLVSPQNSTNASGDGIATESSANVKNNQPTVLQQTNSPAFAQVLREFHDRPALQAHLKPLAPIAEEADDVPLSFLTQQTFENIENAIGADSLEESLRQSQLYGLQTQASQELATQSPIGQDGVSDLLRFNPGTVYEDTIAEDQKNSIQQSLRDGTFSINPHTPLTESQIHANALVQRHTFQSIDGELSSGGVSPVRVANQLVSESEGVIPQAAASKVLEGGASSPHGAQSPEVKVATRVLQSTELLKFSDHPSPTTSKIDLPHVRQSSVPLVPVVPPAGPAGFVQTDSINQLLGKTSPGSVSIANDLSSSVIENRTTLQVDPIGDTSLLNKGDRSQAVIDTGTKIMGLDTSGGQGLGSGLNYPQNSQSGNQQQFMTSGHGVGIRGLEERAAEFPAPTLQRLQMDVQLSETQRVSIDVGVQNRQVYAGLVTDHAVLRNLATQFVPQLENQLADVDMELQEFSAEVREESQEQDDPVFRHSSLTGKKMGQTAQQESVAPQSSVNRQEHAGLHLVA